MLVVASISVITEQRDLPCRCYRLPPFRAYVAHEPLIAMVLLQTGGNVDPEQNPFKNQS